MSGSGGKSKTIRFWAGKVFIISLIISAAFSVVANVFMKSMPLWAAVIVLLVIILIGIVFDIIGVAFASCDQKPFISMSSKKIKKAQTALRLLKNADMVSNICNDVIGDICGIVSGSAGAVIALIVCADAADEAEMIAGIVIASFTAALTISGKAAGKKYAIKNNINIVEWVGSVLAVFKRNK